MRSRRYVLTLLGVLVLGTALPLQMPAPVVQAAPPAHSLERFLAADGTLNLTSGFRGALDARGWTMRTDQSGRPHFTPAAGAQARPASSLDDAAWDSRFGVPGVDGAVYALAISGTNIYVGGAFTAAGNVRANNIARWDGRGWAALGDGVTNTGSSEQAWVGTLVISGTDIYIGGSFSLAGGQAANNIARWDGRAWHAVGDGTNGPVLTIAVSGANIYVGGAFTQAGDINANNIARWDGRGWSALGSGATNGVDGGVSVLAADGNILYAGGGFRNAGGKPASLIARWDGRGWSEVGGGINSEYTYDYGIVTAIAVTPKYVYVGGTFYEAGDVRVNNIARWNGVAWAALGDGLDGYYKFPIVWTLMVSGTDIYAGGAFGHLATGAASIARWDGTKWWAIGGPADQMKDAVSAIVPYSGGLIIGTSGFGFWPQSNPNAIMRWTGGGWGWLNSDMTNGVDGVVNTIAISGTDVYIGGSFTHVGALPAANIARWDGRAWSALDKGVYGTTPEEVRALVVIGANLYAGGTFAMAGSVAANNIARWDGRAWSPVGGPDGLSNTVTALAASGDTLYAGGDFIKAGDLVVNGVARWDGANWSALGTGLFSSTFILQVKALAISGNALYVGGVFDTAGGISVNNIARWDGSAWHPLGSGADNGVDGVVYALAADKNDLYVGGNFTTAGAVSANNIARWDGTNWFALPGRPIEGTNQGVVALTIEGANLYVGSEFWLDDGTMSSNIVRWDGSSWFSLGSITRKTTYFVQLSALAANADSLYAGGDFDHAGGQLSLGFARRLTRPLTHIFLPMAALGSS